MQASDATTKKNQHRESLRNIGNELGKHFPQLTDETELVLMEISPHRLHAYWYITPLDLESAQVKVQDADAGLVIRFHDLTERKLGSLVPPWFDIEIDQASGSQYVELWQDAQSYEAELGLLSSRGNLIDLTRSNRVELPRAGHAPRSGTQVLTLTPLAAELIQQPTDSKTDKADWQENPNQPPDMTLLGSIPGLFPVFPQLDLLTGIHQPLELPVYPKVEHAITLMGNELKTTAEIRQSSALKSASTGQSWGVPDPKLLTGEHQLLELPVFPKVENAITLEAGEQMARAELVLSPPLSIETTRHQTAAIVIKQFPLIYLEEISELSQTETIPVEELISLAKAGQFPAASRPYKTSDQHETLAPLSISSQTVGATTTTSSFELAPQPVSSFELGQVSDEELHIELHIRGRKQPNSQFIFFGQAIPTQQDGTFSLSKKLPTYTLQLVAQLLAATQEQEDD